ncbi:MAG: hypothetical protein A2041_13550 [Bacteroidetes bacterium GWA2_31_9b]|nr:MAG: hypothetical protein A2041_13550 [Bacteroidetes bacterium GWA2_31_9b]
MKQALFVFFLFLTISGFAQSKLTPKQIEKRNYQEVIGHRSNPKSANDTIIPDTYAMYPNGVKGLHEHVANYLKYPPKALENGIQGRVILKFIIEKDGSLTNIEVFQSVDPILDAEAIRVLKTLKQWVPGYVKGSPIRIEYDFPFNFKL